MTHVVSVELQKGVFRSPFTSHGTPLTSACVGTSASQPLEAISFNLHRHTKLERKWRGNPQGFIHRRQTPLTRSAVTFVQVHKVLRIKTSHPDLVHVQHIMTVHQHLCNQVHPCLCINFLIFKEIHLRIELLCD